MSCMPTIRTTSSLQREIVLCCVALKRDGEIPEVAKFPRHLVRMEPIVIHDRIC